MKAEGRLNEAVAEAYYWVNEAARDVIDEMLAENDGEVWLGRVNLYTEEQKAQPIWEHGGGLVYNFGAGFVLPEYDAELERMIRERDEAEYTGTKADFQRVKAIHDRVEALGGVVLVWA